MQTFIVMNRYQIKEMVPSVDKKNIHHMYIEIDHLNKTSLIELFNKPDTGLYTYSENIEYGKMLEFLLKYNLICINMPRWNGDYYIGQRYDDYYIISSHCRDSNLLEESNYQSIKKVLDENKINYIEVCMNHWAVGWLEQLLIKDNEYLGLEFIQDNILDKLQDYPIFDEDDFSNRETEKDIENINLVLEDLKYHFQANSMTYEEKKTYAKKYWYMNSLTREGLMNAIDNMRD